MDIAATSFRVHNKSIDNGQIAVASISLPATVLSATAPYVNNNHNSNN
jgi:hypothetical protein